MSLGAFGVASVLSSSDAELDNIEDYKGLFWRDPWLACIFTGMLLSLAGIPLTVGFIGKFYVFFSAETIFSVKKNKFCEKQFVLRKKFFKYIFAILHEDGEHKRRTLGAYDPRNCLVRPRPLPTPTVVFVNRSRRASSIPDTPSSWRGPGVLHPEMHLGRFSTLSS